MGNVSGTEIGKGQASIGRGLSAWNLIMAKVGAVILVVLGIILIILAFIPMSTQTRIPCKNQQDCTPNEDCDRMNMRCTSQEKKRNPILGVVGLIFFGLAGFSIWYSNTLYTFARQSDENAQVAGLIGEVGLVSSIFNRP